MIVLVFFGCGAAAGISLWFASRQRSSGSSEPGTAVETGESCAVPERDDEERPASLAKLGADGDSAGDTLARSSARPRSSPPGRSGNRNQNPLETDNRDPLPVKRLQTDRARSAQLAVESARRTYAEKSSSGRLRVEHLEADVLREVGEEIGEDAPDWFGYESFAAFLKEALPGIQTNKERTDLLLPGRPTDEDDMLPAIRYLWHQTDQSFPRLDAEGWKHLLKSVNRAANRISWRKPASDRETHRILGHARRDLRRHRGTRIPQAAATYVFSEMNTSGIVHQAMNLRAFRIAFIDHARALAAPSGLPEIEFERMEAWLWGYDFRRAEAQ